MFCARTRTAEFQVSCHSRGSAAVLTGKKAAPAAAAARIRKDLRVLSDLRSSAIAEHFLEASLLLRNAAELPDSQAAQKTNTARHHIESAFILRRSLGGRTV